MKTTTITLKNGDIYIVDVVRQPEMSGHPIRYEVICPDGIPTGETAFGGDNPIYAWLFPCPDEDRAIREFVDKIERLRAEYNYYTPGVNIK